MCGFLVDSGSSSNADQFLEHAHKLRHRGPDTSRIQRIGSARFAFHRLAIVDPSDRGDQPFVTAEGLVLVCNGEIYNEPDLRPAFSHYRFASNSDCEVILPLYGEYGMLETARRLDGEFALVLYDRRREVFYAARDPLGIRPLFYGRCPQSGKPLFASEAKALIGLCERVEVFPPGCIYDGARDRFCRFRSEPSMRTRAKESFPAITRQIRERLTQAVEKRLRADAPVGFLLSGGLDSSLVCAIAARAMDQPIRTFSVGIDKDPIDVFYARQVAEFIGADHREVRFTQQEAFSALSRIIYHLETWDITTIRASVGMYLVCKAIRADTDIKVLLTGEVSDELFGYKYTDYAPSAADFQREAVKRMREIHRYDVLRADRCISAFGLEARVPFGDLAFVDYVMGLDAEVKLNRHGQGKFLLRKAFEVGGYLPEAILWREKAAFSDAVGHSMVDNLKRFAQTHYSDRDWLDAKKKYAYCPPISKEALLYRDIFETHFPGAAHLIPAYWMPNPAWPNCSVSDPSARALPNYGASSHALETQPTVASSALTASG